MIVWQKLGPVDYFDSWSVSPPPQISSVEALIPKVMVFGDVTFERFR